MIEILFIIIIIFLLFFLKSNVEKYSYSDNIDVVYTWVNGRDKNWVDKRYKFTGKESKNDKRVENVNELKYSLISIHKYAPWVNNIYIVVDDIQKPDFIDYSNPKIKIVKHSEIIDSKYLPTFNPCAIEANIHHIPNLTKRFLYFNDDCFLGNHVSKSELTDYVYGDSIDLKDFKPNDDSYLKGLKINYKLVKSKYSDVKCFKPWHQAILCDRDLMYELENIFPDEIHHTNSNNSRNFNIPNDQNDFSLVGLQQLYGLSSGIYKYKEEQPSNQFIEMKNNKHIDKLESLFISKPKLFCINNIESETFPFLDKYFN